MDDGIVLTFRRASAQAFTSAAGSLVRSVDGGSPSQRISEGRPWSRAGSLPWCAEEEHAAEAGARC